MSTQTERLFNRPFTQLFLIQLLSMVTFYSLFVAISPYAVATYHVSTATAGLVAGMTIIGTMIARIFSGLITQHLTAKQMTILSMAILLPSLLAYQLELALVISYLFVSGKELRLVLLGLSRTPPLSALFQKRAAVKALPTSR